MSIWEKCRQYDAVPFFGFPLRPSFIAGFILWEFPEGYNPNGDKVKEVAEELKKFTNGEIIEVTDKIIKIKPNQSNIGHIIYKAFMNTNKR